MKKFILFTLIFITGILLSGTSLAASDEPAEGQLAPDFSIARFDGSEFQLSDFRGKKSVYLVFWNTWCTYCMKKIPKLIDAQQHLQDEIEIIAVNTTLKDSIEKSLVFQKKYNINYPLAFDLGKKITDLYGVWGTPTEFIIDINGVIQHRDGVPDNLRAYLAQWNQTSEASKIAQSAEETPLAKDCNKEQRIC